MEPQNLRELIIKMEARMSTAYNAQATIGQLLMVADMVNKELGNIRDALHNRKESEQPNQTGA